MLRVHDVFPVMGSKAANISKNEQTECILFMF